MSDWVALRKQITKDRGFLCQACGRARWTELHHCLIHREKGNDPLDCIENMMAVCHKCHQYCNAWEIRVKFWQSQCKLYGHERMVAWLDGLELKAPPRFE
jgi:hypothetical protein